MAEIDKARLIELAEAKLEDAKLLLSAGRAANSYYLAGYAVELMLKAIVSARFRTDTLPDRAVSTQVFVHDLRKLISLALLEVALKEREKADAGFQARLQIVLRWTEESRYGQYGVDEATALIDAVDNPEHGVLAWLRSRL
jgi:HEPN domain-containing protein